MRECVDATVEKTWENKAQQSLKPTKDQLSKENAIQAITKMSVDCIYRPLDVVTLDGRRKKWLFSRNVLADHVGSDVGNDMDGDFLF